MAREILNGKIAVATGAARGIGFAIAERLLEEGVKVGFCGARQESVDRAVSELSAKGDLLGMSADVGKRAEVEKLFDAVNSRWGGIDILINNAGIRVYRPVGELNPADWERMLAVNLSGPYYCIHAAIPYMVARGGGDIVNVSSLSSTSPFAGGAGYNASKAGLNGLSGATMLDYRYEGIRVTDVLPGSTNTDFNGPEGRATWKVAPEDIAEAVVLALQMPKRTNLCRIDIRPSTPPKKAS